MRQQTGLPTFVDAFVPEGLGVNETLERIDAMLDWERIGKVVAEVHAAPEGRPGYPPLTMVKIALLQQWYTASDPAMEEALRDRISFRRFVGLGWTDGTPDHSTISRFRKALTERGLTERLFAEVNRQFEELIRKGILTSANVNDTEVADDLVSGDEAAVYADKAYESKERRAGLKSRGIKDRIMHRSHKHQRGLPHWQQQRNALIAPLRAPVERVFGTLKRCYGYGQVRYMGLERNATELWLKCIAFNLRLAARLLFADAPVLGRSAP